MYSRTVDDSGQIIETARYNGVNLVSHTVLAARLACNTTTITVTRAHGDAAEVLAVLEKNTTGIYASWDVYPVGDPTPWNRSRLADALATAGIPAAAINRLAPAFDAAIADIARNAAIAYLAERDND